MRIPRFFQRRRQAWRTTHVLHYTGLFRTRAKLADKHRRATRHTIIGVQIVGPLHSSVSCAVRLVTQDTARDEIRTRAIVRDNDDTLHFGGLGAGRYTCQRLDFSLRNSAPFRPPLRTFYICHVQVIGIIGIALNQRSRYRKEHTCTAFVSSVKLRRRASGRVVAWYFSDNAFANALTERP